MCTHLLLDFSFLPIRKKKVDLINVFDSHWIKMEHLFDKRAKQGNVLHFYRHIFFAELKTPELKVMLRNVEYFRLQINIWKIIWIFYLISEPPSVYAPKNILEFTKIEFNSIMTFQILWMDIYMFQINIKICNNFAIKLLLALGLILKYTLK